MITANVKRFGILVFTSIAVSALFGGFMFFGTLVSGHVRPEWMEFDYTLHWSLIGLAIGAVLWLILDFIRSSRNGPFTRS